MINAIVSKFVSPCQVDFPDSIARSTKGAIHFRPGATVSLTEEEFQYLLDNHSKLASKLATVLKKVQPKPEPKFSMDDVKIADKPLKKQQEFPFSNVSPAERFKPEDTRKIGRKKRKRNVDESEGEKTSSD